MNTKHVLQHKSFFLSCFIDVNQKKSIIRQTYSYVSEQITAAYRATRRRRIRKFDSSASVCAEDG